MLSPIPAKNAANAEPTLMIAALAGVRELRGHGEAGLLCRWDEEDGNGYDGKGLAFWVDDHKILTATDPAGLPRTTRAQAGLVAQVPEAGDNMIIAAFDTFVLTRP